MFYHSSKKIPKKVVKKFGRLKIMFYFCIVFNLVKLFTYTQA